MSGECDKCGEHTLECKCNRAMPSTGWISVEDRLPEVDKGKIRCSNDVLIWDDGGGMYVAYLLFLPEYPWRKEHYEWRERVVGCGCCDDKINPIYWMPLPKPPEKV